MALLIEFLDEHIDLKEIDEMQREGDITLRERAEIQPNGNPGIFLKWWELPAYKLQLPDMPPELTIRYTYRYDIRDGHAAREGLYEGKDIEAMSVQHGLEARDGAKVSRVMIASRNLAKIPPVYEALRSGRLKPTQEWSSSGTVEAPKDVKEASSQLSLPQMAATASKAA